MLYRLKHILIGSPLPTYAIAEKRLNKIRALAAFSPGAISSIAYANQEIYLGLVVAGSMGLLLALILPEFIPAKWWHGFLHNQTSWLIKTALLYRRRAHGYQRVIIDIPYHLRK